MSLIDFWHRGSSANDKHGVAFKKDCVVANGHLVDFVSMPGVKFLLVLQEGLKIAISHENGL